MTLSSLIPAVFLLIVLGVCLYLVETQIPMSPPIKTVIRVLVVLGVCLYLLRLAGVVAL